MKTEASAIAPVTTGAAQAGPGVPRAASSRPSFETKPSRGGTPAMETAASVRAVPVTGMRTCLPASMRRSRVPASWSTMPISMNRALLNSACATVWTTAAVNAAGVPMPMTAVSRPSWLMVE